MTVRLRLALGYCAIFVLTGAALLGLTYALVANLPARTVDQLYVDGSGELPPPTGAEALESQSEQQRSADLRQLAVQSAVALAVMTALSFGVGWLVAGRALKPLRDIAAATRSLTAENLHERLEVTGPPDELRTLAEVINDLLSRLGRSVDAHRSFIGHASHQMRTPLTLERAVLEAAVSDPAATVDSLRAACRRAILASTAQGELIKALLALARSESGLGSVETVDLASTVDDAVARFSAWADDHGVMLDVDIDQPTTTRGDPILLTQLVDNLVDNATRYSGVGGRVRVELRATPSHAVLTIRNTGAHLPADEVQLLRRPFQRLARGHGHHDGHGLGLAIVDAICAAHGGSLDLAPAPEGGLLVTVTVPSAATTVRPGPRRSA